MLRTHQQLRSTPAGLAFRTINTTFWAVWSTSEESGQTQHRSSPQQVQRDVREVLEDHPDAQVWYKDSKTDTQVSN